MPRPGPRRAERLDAEGIKWTAEFTTERKRSRTWRRWRRVGLRFHDLRHSYATELVSRGVPVNGVQAVMGHENRRPR